MTVRPEKRMYWGICRKDTAVMAALEEALPAETFKKALAAARA